MIEFEEAISVARSNVTTLVKEAKNLRLEGAMISADEKLYEITFSYDVSAASSLDFDGTVDSLRKKNSSLFALAQIMGTRREYKIFLVDRKTGKFRGFKNYKEE